jgi:diguanylate cyclase (GGDEF)-like protein
MRQRPRTVSRSHRRLLPWAAAGFALLWGGALGLAISNGDDELMAVSGVGLLLSAILVTMLHRQQTHLRGLAETDPLTGLTNHRGFHQALERELRNAGRERASVALVSLDLDDFKVLNDTHGHPFGDEILQRIGDQLRGSIRTGDIAARTGGEEFALILPGAGPETAYQVAERARSAIARLAFDDTPLESSAGIAVYPGDAADTRTIIRFADGALYWAKRAGKGRTRHFDPEHVQLGGSAQQRVEIERILAPGGIESAFQPVVDLTTGRLVGYEALARFPDSPERPPATWFAQANACGLGPELEAAAIRAALEPIGRAPGVHLAINASPSALSHRALKAALPTDLTGLVIELTEHEVYEGDDVLGAALADLRARGARIAIDDAGAGYAGLKQVMWVRPDIVKLDRELIRAIHADPVRMALVESLVRFARRIGATVCAEGIETLEDVAALANLDVPWGQGFALARPAPPWADVSAPAAETCRSALAQALVSSPGGETTTISAGDRRLEHLSAKLASARSRSDLYSALGLIAGELHADKICLSQWHPEMGAVETLAESGEQPEQELFTLADYPATARVLKEQIALQVIVGDPAADEAEVELMLELGYRSMLMVPVIQRGESLGTLEAQTVDERPWTRTEINRARIISNQFASVIEALFKEDRDALHTSEAKPADEGP